MTNQRPHRALSVRRRSLQEYRVMDQKTEQPEGFEESLAEGIAAVIAAGEDVARPEDLADLFLEELNRLWADPEPLQLS
jgi:hypothetical protein